MVVGCIENKFNFTSRVKGVVKRGIGLSKLRLKLMGHVCPTEIETYKLHLSQPNRTSNGLSMLCTITLELEYIIKSFFGYWNT